MALCIITIAYCVLVPRPGNGKTEKRERKKKSFIMITKDKGRTIPLQAWTGPEGSKSLRLPNFKTVGT